MIAAEHVVTPEEIMAYRDGELSAERAEVVAGHLQSCADCQDMSDVLGGASQILTSWKIAPLASDASFEGRLSKMAASSSSAKRPWIRSRFVTFGGRHPFLSGLLGSVAAIGLVVGVVFALAQRKYAVPLARTKTVTVAELSDNRQLAQSLQTAPADQAATSSEESQPQEMQYSDVRSRLDSLTAQRDALLQRLQMEQLTSNLANPQATPMPQPLAPMIARTVSLFLVVKDFEASRLTLDAVLARHRGYAANLNASTQQNAARSLQASLRIPAADLGSAVAELKALGRIENETQNGEEVTQQHADLGARLKNSREAEQRLQAILLQRTGKIGDVLAVEQEIARVRGEIERMEAEQESLEHRVDFATIDLNLAEEYKAEIGAPSPSISTRFHNALVAGYRNARDSVVGFLVFLAEYGPLTMIWLAVLAALAWFLHRRWVRATSLTL
ncbi:MAG: DUF4349 domain-containing protein [Candidatus Acidiferrum sp.]|jgi:uncharacterized protein DUF4349/putative zinc finger protein